MADNEKRVSTGETQEIPLESLPPIQLPIASDSSSEYDEVSVFSLHCVPGASSSQHYRSGSIELTPRSSTVLLLRPG
jgi:hypothetical protein